MNFSTIVKVLGKSKNWKTLTRETVDNSVVEKLGINIPQKTTNIMRISGERANGAKADIFLFKDNKGVNLGSHSLFSDGTERVINITRGSKHSFDSKLPMLYDIPKTTTIKNQFFRSGVLEKETNLFTQAYKPNKDMASMSPKMYSQMTMGETKPDDITKMYQSVIRVSKAPQTGGTTFFNQEIRQIETGLTPSNKYIKSASTMAQDGEMTLTSVMQNGVNLDTKNPHFQTALLEVHDMLKGNYARIVKERGYKGIEPPLRFNDRQGNPFTGLYLQAGGISSRDGSAIGINLSPYGNIPNRSLLNFRLGHECEHSFVQHTKVHLSGIEDMRSESPISKKFYDEVEKRFAKIKPDTEEYKLAEKYADDFRNYNEKICITGADGRKIIDTKKHDSLITEQHADMAGMIESDYFYKCLNDIKKNFSLFNSNRFMEI